MPFTYNAGTTAPTYAGLVEFNSVRLNDGTYKTQDLGALIEGPPIRLPITPYPNAAGGFIGTAYADVWTVQIDAWMLLATADDVGAALDYLQAAFTASAGPLPLTFQLRGWATARQVTAQVSGPVVINEPDIEHKKLPWREFSIPFVIPDPTVTTL